MVISPSVPNDVSRHQVIGAKTAAELYGLSLHHFRRMYKAGRVPAPIKVGERKLGWMQGVVLDDIAARAQKVAA